LLGSNGGSVGIGAPACAENDKGPREGALGGRVNEKRAVQPPRRESSASISGDARTKKPGAISRPGAIREFQFHE